MPETIWLLLTSISDYAGCFVSLISNTALLIFLIFQNSRGLGTYRYLMINFAIFSIFYTFVSTFQRTLIHVYDNTVFVIQQKRIDYTYSTARYVSASYCFCYAVSFTFSTVNFIYRYWATCRTSYLLYFRGRYFMVWMIAIIVISMSWGGVVFAFCAQTERTQESLIKVVTLSYNISPENVEAIPYNYYVIKNNVETPYFGFFGTVGHHILVMITSFSIIIYCGLATFKKMREFKGTSDRTRQLQNQLFVALVIQTLIPSILMYSPMCLLIICAMFGFNIGVYGNVTVISVHLYPGFNALIVLLMIKEFRRKLKRVFYGRRDDKEVTDAFQRTSITPVGQQSVIHKLSVSYRKISKHVIFT